MTLATASWARGGDDRQLRRQRRCGDAARPGRRALHAAVGVERYLLTLSSLILIGVLGDIYGERRVAWDRRSAYLDRVRAADDGSADRARAPRERPERRDRHARITLRSPKERGARWHDGPRGVRCGIRLARGGLVIDSFRGAGSAPTCAWRDHAADGLRRPRARASSSAGRPRGARCAPRTGRSVSASSRSALRVGEPTICAARGGIASSSGSSPTSGAPEPMLRLDCPPSQLSTANLETLTMSQVSRSSLSSRSPPASGRLQRLRLVWHGARDRATFTLSVGSGRSQTGSGAAVHRRRPARRAVGILPLARLGEHVAYISDLCPDSSCSHWSLDDRRAAPRPCSPTRTPPTPVSPRRSTTRWRDGRSHRRLGGRSVIAGTLAGGTFAADPASVARSPAMLVCAALVGTGGVIGLLGIVNPPSASASAETARPSPAT